MTDSRPVLPRQDTDLTLEVELDLPLESEDIITYHQYMAGGLTDDEAARAVAQGLLGSMGAIVQRAEVVPS